MKETNLPKIIRANKNDKNKIKGVLKLGFSSDPLIRWVFPDPNIYLESFDVWMDFILVGLVTQEREELWVLVR